MPDMTKCKIGDKVKLVCGDICEFKYYKEGSVFPYIIKRPGGQPDITVDIKGCFLLLQPNHRLSVMEFYPSKPAIDMTKCKPGDLVKLRGGEKLWKYIKYNPSYIKYNHLIMDHTGYTVTVNDEGMANIHDPENKYNVVEIIPARPIIWEEDPSSGLSITEVIPVIRVGDTVAVEFVNNYFIRELKVLSMPNDRDFNWVFYDNGMQAVIMVVNIKSITKEP